MPTLGVGEPRGSRTSLVISAAVVATALVRLPLLDLPAWADEAGFLMVGGGWHLGDSPGDRTLYYTYWVDRPPVLITLFGLADQLGGLLPLRLLGALAAAVTVAGVAWVAHTAAGTKAAGWAAVTGAALLSTPLHWSFMVDGELLAAPFVATGIGCVARGLATEGGRGLLLPATGGALATCAILTKQNIADVFVFLVAFVSLSLLHRSASRRQAARHVAAFGAGVVGLGGIVAAWTLAHGTALDAVLYAMYPFRLDAAATPGGTVVSWNRLVDLGIAALLSGLLVLAVWGTCSGVRRRHRDVHVLALLAVLGFDLFSMAAGASYWLHYLVQPAVPVAALTGILAARGSWARFLVAWAVVASVVEWLVLVRSPPQTGEEMVGEAVAQVSTTDDTILTLPGRSNVDLAAGLRSPYPHLWALPARTLDPGSTDLKELLAGRRAPTWVVVYRPARRRPPPGTVGAVIVEHYRLVTRICGASVYVNRAASRATPTAEARPDATRSSRCESATALPRGLRELSERAR